MQDVPYGFCHCGCGQQTRLSTQTRRGYRRGEPLRFIHGHNVSKGLRYEVRDCGYETPCWVWLLGKDAGYGRFMRDGVHLLVHRVMYEEHVGPIPSGLHIDHLCRNRACVNPEHLEAVTPAENQHRRIDLALTDQTAREIKDLLRGGWPQVDIADAYGVSQSLICDIKKGRAWRTA